MAGFDILALIQRESTSPSKVVNGDQLAAAYEFPSSHVASIFYQKNLFISVINNSHDNRIYVGQIVYVLQTLQLQYIFIGNKILNKNTQICPDLCTAVGPDSNSAVVFTEIQVPDVMKDKLHF